MGNAEEIGAFCSSEYGRLVGLLSLYCGDASIAEDLAQETLVRVWTNWGRVSRLDDPAAWAHKVAYRLAKSSWRRHVAEAKAKARLVSRPREPTVVDLNERRAIVDALESLPQRQRMALVLRFYLDFSYEDVAARMDIPSSTARSLVRRGLQKLGKQNGLATQDEETSNVIGT